jgi:uncharacterized UPF0146 family protein
LADSSWAGSLGWPSVLVHAVGIGAEAQAATAKQERIAIVVLVIEVPHAADPALAWSADDVLAPDVALMAVRLRCID